VAPALKDPLRAVKAFGNGLPNSPPSASAGRQPKKTGAQSCYQDWKPILPLFFWAAGHFFKSLRGAGCSPRLSRLSATSHDLFFTGRFFGVAWQLLIICKNNRNATPKKRYVKNQTAIRGR
jgi:hypothetical protein